MAVLLDRMVSKTKRGCEPLAEVESFCPSVWRRKTGFQAKRGSVQYLQYATEQIRDYATHSNGQDQSWVQETEVGSTPTWFKLALIARQDRRDKRVCQDYSWRIDNTMAIDLVVERLSSELGIFYMSNRQCQFIFSKHLFKENKFNPPFVYRLITAVL